MIKNGTAVIVNQGGALLYGTVRGSTTVADIDLLAIDIDFEKSPHMHGYDYPTIILPEELVDIEIPNIIHVDFRQWN